MLTLLWTCWLTAAHALPLDRVEVVVEDQLVLSSDIALDALLQGLDSPASPFWATPPSDARQRLADAALLRHLAADLAIYQPSSDDLQARLDALVLEHFSTRGAWESFLAEQRVDQEEVRVMLRRRMVAERYLSRNLRVSPVDEEAWRRAADELLARERERARVRVVPAREHL